MSSQIKYFLIIFIWAWASVLSAQDQNPDKKVKVKNADNFITEISDEKDIQYFRGNVKIVHDSIFMFCDSTTINENKLNAVGNVIIVQDDTINVFSDSLYYDGDKKIAELFFNVVLQNGEKKLFTESLLYNLETKKATFQDTAILESHTMTLSSLKGVYDVESKRAKFYEQVTIIDGSFELKADSLDYDTDIDRAYFIGPTFITENDKQIYCEEGYYDIENGRANFAKNAVIKQEDQTAKALSILISEQDSSMTLVGNAEIKDSTSIAKGDEIYINDSTGDITIEGNAYYKKDEQVLEGPKIEFNNKTENIRLVGPSTINNKEGYLKGDTIYYIKEKDFGKAIGNVYWLDSIDNRTIITDELEYKEEVSYYKATAKDKRPLFSQVVEDDTLYLSADTLISSNEADSLSFISAIKDVRIFKNDLQAICDSLYYSDQDSLFRLFQDPVCWSDTTQFSGDTITIKLTDNKVSDIIADKNGFIITHDSGDFYNQIKGKKIHSYLDSNELKLMVIKGNAESIYMVKDEEKAYVGANKNTCSHMAFHMKNQELDHIDFYTQPDNNMVPMEKAAPNDLKLDGFVWRISERPKDKDQLRNFKFIGEPIQVNEEDEFESKVFEIFEEEAQGSGDIKDEDEKKPDSQLEDEKPKKKNE